MSARPGMRFTPFLLRLALGTVFIWSGLSKMFYDDHVTGQKAMMLAKAGIIAVPAGVPLVPAPVGDTPTADPTDPADTPTLPGGEPADPTVSTPAAPSTDPSIDPADEENPDEVPGGARSLVPDRIAPEDVDDPLEPTVPEPITAADVASSSVATLTPELFTDPVKVPRRYGVIAAIQGAVDRGQWPSALATPDALKAQALAVALTELVGGVFILLGFMGRLAGLALAGVMAGALWLTQIGPALQSSTAFLGFLPDPKLADGDAWIGAWSTMLFQFTLLMAALGVTFAGSGCLSLDSIFFREKRRRAIDED